ncbi:MAG: hypothetical protein ACJAXK_003234 [Yoonia sp.]|jgi:hypothetical protein
MIGAMLLSLFICGKSSQSNAARNRTAWQRCQAQLWPMHDEWHPRFASYLKRQLALAKWLEIRTRTLSCQRNTL